MIQAARRKILFNFCFQWKQHYCRYCQVYTYWSNIDWRWTFRRGYHRGYYVSCYLCVTQILLGNHYIVTHKITNSHESWPGAIWKTVRENGVTEWMGERGGGGKAQYKKHDPSGRPNTQRNMEKKCMKKCQISSEQRRRLRAAIKRIIQNTRPLKQYNSCSDSSGGSSDEEPVRISTSKFAKRRNMKRLSLSIWRKTSSFTENLKYLLKVKLPFIPLDTDWPSISVYYMYK